MEIASKQIHKNLMQIPQFRLCTKVAFYYPTGSEVFTQGAIQEAISKGLAVYLPKVVGNNLEFRRIDGFTSLEQGSFDILEPKDSCLSVEPSDIEVMIIPAVGASEDCFRLGYGHGFYDKFLAKKGCCDTDSVIDADTDTIIDTDTIPSPIKIAICFQKQIVKSIPNDVHDSRMDFVVTEDRIYRSV